MPELPEVETVVRGLRAPLTGRRILAMWQDWHRALQAPSPEAFAARIAGQRIQGVQRRGKYVLIPLEQDTLVIHLKMSGRLYVTQRAAKHAADRWVHLYFELDRGQQLRFSDARKFGRAALTGDIRRFLQHLGPEPLSPAWGGAALHASVQGRKRAIKSHLLDQSVVAGIGNIYADEALFRARIHPAQAAGSLSLPQARALHAAVVEALEMGIAQEGASINWYRKADGNKGSSQEHFLVYGRQNLPCQRCGTTLQKTRVAQRGTHFCPECQPALA